MKKFTLGLLSAAAVATTILLVRQQLEDEAKEPRVGSGDAKPTLPSIERMREAGL
jgi:hypothetical protein